MKNKVWALIWGIGLTFLFLLPIVWNLNTHLTSRQDGLLVSWLIDWGSQAFLSGQNFFNPPFFYPYQNTIGYSDLFLSTALINLPFKILGIDPITSHNLHLLGGSILIFWGQYLLVKHLLHSHWIALISASTFSFTGIHLQYAVHLHTFLIAGLPFYFLFFCKFLEKKQTKYLLGMILAGLYQALNSPQTALFVLLMTLIFLFDKQIRKIFWNKKKQIITLGLGALILVGFFYWPYLQVSQEFAYTRNIRDTAHFSQNIEKIWEPEILFFLSLNLGLWVIAKNKPQKNGLENKPINSNQYLPHFLIISILGAILMLGPVVKHAGQTLKIFSLPIPLPYAIFYYLFPGFKAFRASDRWIVIFGFGMSICLGYLSKSANLKKSSQIFLLGLIIFFLWLTQFPRLKLFEIPLKIPPIYEIIKNRPEQVLAEFPAYDWSMFDNYYREGDRLYYQNYHQKKLYNGYSGFIPPARERELQIISQNLTAEKSLSLLKESGVELVLLHLNESANYKNIWAKRLNLIKCLENDCLYSLH